MSHGNRNNRRTEVRADPRAVESRRHESENRNNTSAWNGRFITDPIDLEQACLDILHGKPGLYPIFGIQLHVEERHGPDSKYPVLIYTDALFGEEGQNLCGMIPPGFTMSPAMLIWNVSANTKFKTPYHELITLTLLSKTEMQSARMKFADEKMEEDRRLREKEREEMRQEEARKRHLEKLRTATFGSANVQQEPKKDIREKKVPILASLSDILTATNGQIEHDGLTVFLTGAPEGGIAVRVKNAPEGHPMHEVARKNIFADQSALRYAGDRVDAPATREGNAQLRYELRTYLRGELMASGVILTPPAESLHMNGQGDMVGNSYLGKDPGVEASSAS